MDEEMRKKLERHKLKTLTILFGGCSECEDFESFGETVQLEDMCGHMG